MLMIIVLGAAFVGVAALVGGVAILLRGETSTPAEERLDILAGAKPAKVGKADSSVLSSPLNEGRSFAEELLSRLGNVQRFFDQADSPISASQFLLITAGLGCGGFLFCLVFPGIPKATAPLAGLLLGVFPGLWLFLRRRRRLKAFAQQLPEALELIARALRAGHSLGSGFNLVSNEMPEPIRSEFACSYEAQNLGVPLEEALEEMTERVPNLDLRFFATAVILQRQTGGDLAEILDKIGRLIRERFKIWGQIQALTGEGRLSGIVLLALPPVLFVTMYRLNPEYVMVLFNDPMGHKMLAVAVVMQLIGALVIKKIINIKV